MACPCWNDNPAILGHTWRTIKTVEICWNMKYGCVHGVNAPTQSGCQLYMGHSDTQPNNPSLILKTESPPKCQPESNSWYRTPWPTLTTNTAVPNVRGPRVGSRPYRMHLSLKYPATIQSRGSSQKIWFYDDTWRALQSITDSHGITSANCDRAWSNDAKTSTSTILAIYHKWSYSMLFPQ